MPERTKPVAWLLAPAVDIGGRSRDLGLAFLRVLVGLMWLYNVGWKRATDFGAEADNGLYHYTAYAVSHPVLAPFSWLVENLVLPHITIFGYGVLIAETALAVMLLTGAYVRVAALLGIAQSAAIALSVAFAPNEWPWSYWLMIGAHVVLLLGVSGRAAAIDAVRHRLRPAARLALAWGVLAVLVGAWSVVGSLGDPLAPRGTGLVSSDLSISLGQYNLAGGLLLVISGALLLLAARGTRVAGFIAAALGVLGALTLHAQLGFTDPVLGGTPTSAAFMLAVAAVALTTALHRRDRHPRKVPT